MAGDTAPERVAHNMRHMSIDEITREISERCDRAHSMNGSARTVSLDFNARLVTALVEQNLWPTRKKPQRSAFQ